MMCLSPNLPSSPNPFSLFLGEGEPEFSIPLRAEYPKLDLLPCYF
jgi:hypothetical protein